MASLLHIDAHPVPLGSVVWDRSGGAHYLISWDGVTALVRPFTTGRAGRLMPFREGELFLTRPTPAPRHRAPLLPAVGTSRAPRPTYLPAPGETVQCFACDRALTPLMVRHAADTREPCRVIVGPECWRYIRAAGEEGYQPPTGGPRLWIGPRA